MSARRYKMKDLERATGVGREAIRFYIREGLLPEPDRPGRNVAWYDESFVERIALIKDLQQKRFLPLQVIKAILGGGEAPRPAEVEAILDLDGKLFRSAADPRERAGERLSDLARRTGVAAADVRRLAATGAFEVQTRKGAHWLDGAAVRVVELWAELKAAGFTEERGGGPENLRVYVDMVRWLAREELRLFARGVTGRVEPEEAVRMAEAGIEILNRLIAVLRKSFLLRYIAEGNVPEGGREELPSEVG